VETLYSQNSSSIHNQRDACMTSDHGGHSDERQLFERKEVMTDDTSCLIPSRIHWITSRGNAL
jgi:hypothetical protein